MSKAKTYFLFSFICQIIAFIFLLLTLSYLPKLYNDVMIIQTISFLISLIAFGIIMRRRYLYEIREWIFMIVGPLCADIYLISCNLYPLIYFSFVVMILYTIIIAYALFSKNSTSPKILPAHLRKLAYTSIFSSIVAIVLYRFSYILKFLLILMSDNPTFYIIIFSVIALIPVVIIIILFFTSFFIILL